MRELLICLLPILALYSPEVAFMRLGDEVDALVGGREVELLTRNSRNLVETPDVLKLRRVFGCELKIGFSQVFEPIPFLLFCFGGPGGMDLSPSVGSTYCGKKRLRPRSHVI